MTLTDFTRFNPTKYNALPEVEDSSKALQQHPNFTEFLKNFYSLTKEYSIKLGVRLIHRHLQVDERKVMVEKFQLHQGVPALITSADFPTDKTYPASWLIENNNELSVFEYTTDIQVKHNLEKLIEDTSIFIKVCELIRKYHLEDSLAPCITARDSFKYFVKNDGFIEITDFESNASIVKNTKDQTWCISEGVTTITTLWEYHASDKVSCSRHCNHCTHCRHCGHCTHCRTDMHTD